VALEGRRLDRLESLVAAAPDKPAILGYALRVCQKLVVNRDFRQQVRAIVCSWLYFIDLFLAIEG
jgi:hypothetical protein